MNNNTVRIFVSLSTLICCIILIAINKVPRGNFITGPAISLFIYTPLLLAQVFLLIQLWIVGVKSERKLRVSLYCSLAIDAIFILLFLHFIKSTT
jgi:hypothetical protein